MAIPHQIFKKKAKKRLIGKEGKTREREIKKLISELPGYRSGPFADIRKWLKGQVRETKKIEKSKARKWFNIKKQGDGQVVIIGPPNIGKSSLLKKLSNIQIKIANFEFTTLKPVASIINFDGASIQLVEIPGLIEGASRDKGGGKALLAAARGADLLILMTSIDTGIKRLIKIYKEIKIAKLISPCILICNKIDLENSKKILKELKENFKDMEIIPISIEKNLGLKRIKESIWSKLELIRVFSKDDEGIIAKKPTVLKNGARIADFAEKIHGEVKEKFRFAKVERFSKKLLIKQVGLNYILQDKDIVRVYK